MQRLLLACVLIVGALSGFVQGGTYASFTSAAQSTGNQFTAGTLTLGAGITTGTLTVSNLVPGDSFTARLSVQNSGSLTLRYAMTTSISGSSSLGSALQLAIRTDADKDGSCSTSSAGDETLYSTAALSSAAFGDPSQGAQTGDRELTPSGSTSSEDLCFTVQLPSNTSTTLAGTNVTATFTFSAEQVAGN